VTLITSVLGISFAPRS